MYPKLRAVANAASRLVDAASSQGHTYAKEDAENFSAVDAVLQARLAELVSAIADLESAARDDERGAANLKCDREWVAALIATCDTVTRQKITHRLNEDRDKGRAPPPVVASPAYDTNAWKTAKTCPGCESAIRVQRHMIHSGRLDPRFVVCKHPWHDLT